MYCFMIKHVIMAWVREQQRWRDATQQVSHLADRRLVENQIDIRLIEAVILGPDLGRRCRPLFETDRRDVGLPKRGRAAVTVGNRGNMYLPTRIGQTDKRAAAL